MTIKLRKFEIVCSKTQEKYKFLIKGIGGVRHFFLLKITLDLT